jgi:uncharacterized protein (DUF433 family)
MAANPSYPYDIRETPGVCGGYPCIGGTRIPVRMIVELYRDTDDLDQTAAMFPQLTRQQVEEALAFYRDFPARVDEDIARNAATLARLQALQPR